MTNGIVPNPIQNIPPNDVGDVVQNFINYDSVTKMEVFKQPNGNFTVAPAAVD